MKENQELYNYLKTVHAPQFKDDSFKKRLKNELYNIMDKTEKAKAEGKAALWKWRLTFALAGSVLVCAVILCLIFIAPELVHPSFMISSICGEVTAIYNDDQAALILGEPIAWGTTITAGEGASCDVRINRSSLLRIYERSIITLDEKENMITIQLAQGTLVAHIEKSERPFDLQLITDNCIIGIQSTTFMVKVEQDKVTQIALLEGLLSIKTDSGIADKEYILQSDRELELTLDSMEISTAPLSAEHRDALLLVKNSNFIFFTDVEKSVTCTIQPMPEDAAVYVNGQKMGRGKLSLLTDKAQEIKLKVVRQGYDLHESIIKIEEDKTFNIMLKKKNASEPSEMQTPRKQDEEIIEEHTGESNKKVISQLKGTKITIDGSINDWQPLTPVITDPRDDIKIDIPEADITRVFLAKNSDTLYACIAFARVNISDLLSIEYHILIMEQNNPILTIIILYEAKQLKTMLVVKSKDEIETVTSLIGDVASGDGFIEVAFPLRIINKYLSEGSLYSCKITSRMPKNQFITTAVNEAMLEELSY